MFRTHLSFSLQQWKKFSNSSTTEAFIHKNNCNVLVFVINEFYAIELWPDLQKPNTITQAQIFSLIMDEILVYYVFFKMLDT